MFGGFFNRIPFNRPLPALWDIPLSCIFADTTQCIFTVGVNGTLSMTLGANLHTESILTHGLRTELTGMEVLDSDCTVRAQAKFDARLYAVLGAYADLGKNHPVALAGTDGASSAVGLSKNTVFRMDIQEQVDCTLVLCKTTDSALVGTGQLLCICDLYTPKTEHTYLDVTIPAGGTLVLDSEHMQMLLNGENVLHLHKGDWLQLCRDMLYLDVDCASGTATGSLVVTPRFL